jgi:glycosyltransferase involved in cell wall biosynthesis
MDKPRIAYLVSEYPHIRHAYLLREIRGLRQLGFDIETIAMRAGAPVSGSFSAAELEERKRCFYVLSAGPAAILAAHLATLLRHPFGCLRGLTRAVRFGPRGLFYFAEAVIAGRHIERRGLTHVHTHYASTVAWILAAIFPIELSITIHGSGEFDDPVGFRLKEKIAASHFVRAISFFGRSQLMRACPPTEWSKLEVCRLGVDVPPAPTRPPRAPGASFHLLCVGGMAPPRAFETIIHALAIDADPAVSLTLVGDGPDRPRLEALARESGVAARVAFAGWKSQQELQALYAVADAFVFSSFAEGIPVVLMEAMARSLPCIAPAIAGIPELIRHGIDGLLTAPSDERAIADAIRRLHRDPDFCRSLGASSRARILELYNLDRNVAEMAEIFERRITN